MEGDSEGREKGMKGKEIIATGANGIVKWFDPALGYGFITRRFTTETTRSDTTVFFHYSAIVENSEHATPLQQGQVEKASNQS
jgi:cold shock CspA family protein